MIDEATALWLKETYISYRTVLHHLSLERDGERIVAEEPYRETRARLHAIWHAALESGP